MAIPAPGKNFGPYKFIGSDADGTDTTYTNDTWTFKNLTTSGGKSATMHYFPPSIQHLRVLVNGVVQREGALLDFVFTAGANGDYGAGKITFTRAIDDAEYVTLELINF